MKEEIEKAKKVLEDGLDVLKDFFKEKRSDTITREFKKAKKDVALVEFEKGLIGTTKLIKFRLLMGEKKDFADRIYEGIWKEEQKEPTFYVYKINRDEWRVEKKVEKKFRDSEWDGFKSFHSFKSVDDFLKYVYNSGVYYKGEKLNKDKGLSALVKKGLKKTLKAIGEDVKEEKGEGHPTAKKVAKFVAIAAATTIVSAALTPAAGAVATEIATGGATSGAGGNVVGNVAGKAAEAAGQGLKKLADPTELAKKGVKKVVTKGKDVRD